MATFVAAAVAYNEPMKLARSARLRLASAPERNGNGAGLAVDEVQRVRPVPRGELETLAVEAECAAAGPVGTALALTRHRGHSGIGV
jgi:hypothetical protein